MANIEVKSDFTNIPVGLNLDHCLMYDGTSTLHQRNWNRETIYSHLMERLKTICFSIKNTSTDFPCRNFQHFFLITYIFETVDNNDYSRGKKLL